MQVGDESARIRCGWRYHRVRLATKITLVEIIGWRASRPKVEGEMDFPCSDMEGMGGSLTKTRVIG